MVDGRPYQHPTHEDGFFLGGCLFDHVTANMRIYREEIFGPVLCVVRVPDFDSALDLVNRHEFEMAQRSLLVMGMRHAHLARGFKWAWLG